MKSYLSLSLTESLLSFYAVSPNVFRLLPSTQCNSHALALSVVRSCFSYVNSNVNNFNVLQNWEKNHLPEAAPVYLEAAVLLLFNGIRNNMNILVKI
tara:strand:- start:466 stop:756 length:291 start_codon:yes stop_codon:yes gene_type:complete